MNQILQQARSGLKHRLICSTPLLAAFPMFAFEYSHSSASLDLLPVLGVLVASATAFMQPIILTEGFNLPTPPSGHLRIGTVATGKLLFYSSMFLMLFPSWVRLAARLAE